MKTISPNFSAVIIGAMICLVLLLTFIFLGLGIGVVTDKAIREGDFSGALTLGTGIFGIFGVIISFFVGAWITSRLANQKVKLLSVLHGAGMWAMACLFLFVFVASGVFSSIGKIVTQASLGVNSAANFNATLEQFREMRPRIVTDLSILKGKAVSEIILDKPRGGVQDEVIQDIKGQVKHIKEDPAHQATTKGILKDVSRACVIMSWMALGVLFSSGLSSVFGSRMEWRKPLADTSMH